jgi:Mg2+/Co2+ transporter CorB
VARADAPGWDARGECLVEGSALLRDLNKRLGLDFPLDGPKTINGLLLEYLQDIPEAHVSVRLAGCVIEIIQAQNQAIKVVKLIRQRK